MNKVFSHPIWSKVIAGVILMFLGWLFSWINQVNWSEIKFGNLRIYLDYFPGLFYLLLIFILLLILFVIELVKRLILYTKRKLQTKEFDDTSKDYYFNAGRKTTEFFSGRIGDAFPGLRGFKWIKNSKKAIERLEILLRNPLKFNVQTDHLMNATVSPIWWFSRGYSMDIDSFKILRYPLLFGLIKGKILIGWDEFVVNKIGVYHSPGEYYLDLVYIETLAGKRTRLYKKKKGKNKTGRETEEYALFKGKKITREEYDDGSATINGKVESISGAELRVRNLTKFNFIICAKGSPYNSNKFDSLSIDEFDSILDGVKPFEDVFKKMRALPRRDK